MQDRGVARAIARHGRHRILRQPLELRPPHHPLDRAQGLVGFLQQRDMRRARKARL
jgi:hypothetical protein